MYSGNQTLQSMFKNKIKFPILLIEIQLILWLVNRF